MRCQNFIETKTHKTKNEAFALVSQEAIKICASSAFGLRLERTRKQTEIETETETETGHHCDVATLGLKLRLATQTPPFVYVCNNGQHHFPHMLPQKSAQNSTRNKIIFSLSLSAPCSTQINFDKCLKCTLTGWPLDMPGTCDKRICIARAAPDPACR